METVATEPGTCLRRLPDDLVADEILTRLPARSLARFASVCGAWRAAISGDPSSFLRRRRKKEHSSSFLLLLYALVEDAERRLAFSNHVPFYRLRWPDDGGDGAPQLVHVSVFGDGGEEPTLSLPRTCDGLVLLPNGDDVHVINPATGDVLTLPQSSRVAAAADHSTGLGLATRTNTYKDARYIHLSTAAAAAAAEDDGAAVMEVFTIGHGDAAAWRETTTPPPPSYPVCHVRTATHSRGNLFWKLQLRRSPAAAAAGSFLLLRFNLAHETFTVVHHPRPPSHLPSADQNGEPPPPPPPLLSELDGELCLGLLVSGRQELWQYSNNGGGGGGEDAWQWEQRFSIAVSGPDAMYLPLGVLRRHDRLLLQKGVHLYHHDSGGGEESVREVARMDEFEFEWSFPGEPYAFMVIPYTESLVRVTAARPINKTAAATAMAGETAATMMATPERPKRARRANSRYIGDMWDV